MCLINPHAGQVSSVRTFFYNDIESQVLRCLLDPVQCKEGWHWKGVRALYSLPSWSYRKCIKLIAAFKHQYLVSNSHCSWWWQDVIQVWEGFCSVLFSRECVSSRTNNSIVPANRVCSIYMIIRRYKDLYFLYRSSSQQRESLCEGLSMDLFYSSRG